MTGENGLREALSTLRREADRLWEHKASKTEVAHVRENMSRLEASVSEDIRDIRVSVSKIEELIEKRREDRVEEKKQLVRDRQVNRRWYVGTMIAALGLVVAAMAILIPLLTNTPAAQ